MPSKKRREVLTQGKRLGQRMVEEHSRSVPLLFWYAVNLGRWAEEYGLLAAAGEGVPGRMRKLCEEIIRLEPRYREGGRVWTARTGLFQNALHSIFLNVVVQ